ncbi:alpha-1,3-glucan synthase [Xylariales sp. PMI_506]|nr:alpha-1,3-glucan synthase [Xylariales sp. PMI_506]
MSISGVRLFVLTSALVSVNFALRYEASQVAYNLNQNVTASDPLDYWGEWDGHNYTSSPGNWRFPFYTLSLDRYSNGDPTNDDANGTQFENDWMSNQFRFGGDARGLMNDLDYIQGIGIKAIYLMAPPFINQPWMADGYSPLDLTLLDHHHGDIEDWRNLINAIHERNMFVLFDNTLATMGDLIGFQGHLNESTPFNWNEYNYVWKTERRYFDFLPGDAVNESCEYPRFWTDDGWPMTSVIGNETGCRISDFSQYGDLPSTGHYPPYETQLTKYGSVQDRLREWRSDVLARIKHFACMQISMFDIDGFRIDKALQASIDALAEFSDYQRQCARQYGKENFLVIGEVVGTSGQSAIYVGRGKQPDMYSTNFTEAVMASNTTDSSLYVRDFGLTALDAPAFQYEVYAALARLLGLDSDEGTDGVDLVSFWNTLVLEYDLVNANTGEFDPRIFFGTSDQDVFRWPSVVDGTQRQLLGQFLMTLELPGAPALYWGEEQSFYILDNTASNYVYGRQPMSSSRGWQLHGCYALTDSSYNNMPLGPALDGCHDDNVSLDHKDPSHPVRNIIKRMYELRQQYPTLNDGYYLEALSNQTYNVYLPGSDGIASPTGMWSVYRSRLEGIQDLSGSGQGNQGIWIVYSNENTTTEYSFDCNDASLALVSPFLPTIVKNLFYPYDEYVLENSSIVYNRDGLRGFAGCLSNLTMPAWGFKAFVPKENFTEPAPTITGIVPSHDSRLTASVAIGGQQTVPIEIHFSIPMDCESVTNSLLVSSTTEDGITARIDNSTVSCNSTEATTPQYVGQPATTWSFSANLIDVSHGIHTVTVRNATSQNGTYTNSMDRFMFRVGRADNPVVFPDTANYTRSLLHKNETTGDLYISPKAPGADMFRYSRTWGSSWSSWANYTGGNVTLEEQAWSGTAAQEWTGEHVMVQFWSSLAASSSHIQHADLDPNQVVRRWPHAFVLGAWNTWGFDDGLANSMSLASDGTWVFDLAAEWPTKTTINVWGMDPDGQPDKTMQYGDIDGDYVLDWLHPDTLSQNVVNMTSGPGMPYMAWRIVVNDGNWGYSFEPIGSGYYQLALSILLGLVPPITGCLALWIFRQSYYQVKFNQIGIAPKLGPLGLLPFASALSKRSSKLKSAPISENHRTVLIATMEYEIEDWNIKIKIGGLGVMASLMGKALGHQNLIWVVPCVGGIDYPTDTIAEPMAITINDQQYKIDVQYHTSRNITYVLLDAPIFRLQSKAEPYPARMDDLGSAIYYSAWNACIAETIKRFPIDLYHINDYHGAIAPLYLLPHTIPVSLSLHNAEFQGLWPIRSDKEMHEITKVFNLPSDVVKTYVQFGEVFNLLHAGASYLRIHQRGFGAVGVSKKYGVRVLKRYPIFWGLSTIGSLPNPDPADTAELDEKHLDPSAVVIDAQAEAERGEFRTKAQAWAGLEENPNAQLFVFVGRWSEQKGVDLIADVFPAILDKHRDVQLICIGPVIDMYGNFAALKLEKIMARYPGRVYSKPEFTALPPFIFSGAEFALIPSRDEPFGLVAVEFGRKGALGVGSRVGGLGQMPGWWFTIESTATKHLLRQFKSAISAALASSQQTRAMMRARSSIQRFPVAQWIKDLEVLQGTSIEMHQKVARGTASILSLPISPLGTGTSTPAVSVYWRDRRTPGTAPGTAPSTVPSSVVGSRAPSPVRGGPQSVTSFSASDSGMSTPTRPRLHGVQSMAKMLTPKLNALAELAERNGDDEIAAAATDWNYSPSSESGSSARRLELAPANNNDSVLSINSVVRGRKDFNLQNVDPFFNDPTGRYFEAFSARLDAHQGSLSSDKLCIEEYLRKSEKDWFNRFYDAKMGKSGEATPAPSIPNVPKEMEFQISPDHVHPTGLKRLLMVKIWNWPMYTFLLALAQVISANSYQITLLTGANGESADKLYVVSSIFLGATIAWWILFRWAQSIYTLSLPFFFYGSAFFLLGMQPYATTTAGTTWVQNVATGFYAVGSASGFMFFTQNFGSEGGTTVQTWVFRACAIQGTQQIYIAGLWYWGEYTSAQINDGVSASSMITATTAVTAIGVPIAVLLWVIGIVLFLGLPEYYRNKPGKVPAFYPSLMRRKVVVWFFVVVIIQNYWLSAPYGRSWTYLWSSNIAPAWAVAILVVAFFIGIWAVVLAIFASLSREHSWALPLFAIGLGAPRWCQMLWGTSGMGLYLPWVPHDLTGALLGRALWLWLGVLDNIQGVGFGMMLLQTLTRLHMTGAIAAAQVLGSLFTIAARASAPNRIGPGPVFPNLPMDLWAGLVNVWLWVPLVMQLAICVGFFVFFRKEQLFKP